MRLLFRRAPMMWLFAAVASLSALWWWLTPAAVPWVPAGWTSFRGEVSQATIGRSGARMVVEVDTVNGQPVGGFKALVWLGHDAPLGQLQGSRVAFGGFASLTDTLSAAPYRRFLRSQGIEATVGGAGGTLVVLRQGEGWGAWLSRCRHAASMEIAHSGLSPAAAAFIDAVVMGNASRLSADVRREFSRAGIAHVLALSGTHVAVLAFLLVIVVRPLRFGRWRNPSLWAIIAALWFYAALTGLSPSVVRASAMASGVLLGYIWKRDVGALNMLGAAGFLIVVFSPRSVLMLGFWMSFAAVASILLFQRAVPIPWWWKSYVSGPLRWLLVCLAALLGTAPLTLWAFHILPTLFFVSNIPLAVALPLFMIGGLLLILLRLCLLPAGWLCWLLDGSYGLLHRFVNIIVSLPHSSLSVEAFPLWGVATAYLLLALALLLLRRLPLPRNQQ